ncbi:MAG: YcxB family protein [Verrucomicrobiota bacterium]
MPSFQITPEEHAAASTSLARFHFWLRRGILAFIIFGYLAYSISIYGFLWNVAIICVVGFILACLANYFISQRRMKKNFLQHAAAKEQIELEFDDEGLNYKTDSAQFVLKWENVRKWRESNQFFFLFESNAFARYIPLRALNDSEAALIREKLAATKRSWV